MNAREVVINGESVLLLPQKALYWPREKMLVIADIHFGKAAAFRAQGVPVPRGTTTQNLEALDELMGLHETRQIIFLGDFLHARASHASATVAAMLAWRLRHPHLRLLLVRGNHDLRAGDPSASLGIEMSMSRSPLLLSRFAIIPILPATATCWPVTCIRCLYCRGGSIPCACRAFWLDPRAWCCHRSAPLPAVTWSTEWPTSTFM